MSRNLPYELRPYMQEPPAMSAGAIGKNGGVELVFTLNNENGKSYLSQWSRRVPLIVQQELYFDELMPQMPCVYILSSGGPNVDGDRYTIDLKLRQGAFAHISTGAATKIAEMRYNHASNHQSIVLDEESYLEYIPLPIIPCKNSRYLCDTKITIAPSATLFYSEIFCAGREFYGDGEVFKYDLLSISTCATTPSEKLLFREKMVIEPQKHSCCTIGRMGHFKHFADITILTPEKNINPIIEKHPPYLSERGAIGVNYLSNKCGINIKILSNSVEELKKEVRTICSTVRMIVKGYELPKEFPWR